MSLALFSEVGKSKYSRDKSSTSLEGAISNNTDPAGLDLWMTAVWRSVNLDVRDRLTAYLKP